MSVKDQSLAGQGITVPPNLPMILKQFCKAAIRTQPYDLLKWASSYFRALADGEEPPTKLRLEHTPSCTTSGLTLGFLRVLLRQFGDYNKSLPVETILQRWDCLCLDRRDLNLIMMIGRFRRKCQVKKFLAIAVGLLGSSLFETMIMICELFTNEPEGGSAMVPVTLFMEIYGYLAGLKCDGSERDSPDDDPMQYIICEESNGSRSSSEIHSNEQGANEEKLSIDRVCSVTSQDTEADVNLDLELVSKEDVCPLRTDVMTELRNTFTAQKETMENKSEKEPLTCRTSNSEENNIRKSSGSESSRKSKLSDSRNSLKENLSEKRPASSNGSDKQSEKNERAKNTASGKGKRKKIVVDPKIIKCYPKIPGIGPRLMAEEVASVAIWMSECARLQEGMVGPRNLRHMNCPPLDKQKLMES